MPSSSLFTPPPPHQSPSALLLLLPVVVGIEAPPLLQSMSLPPTASLPLRLAWALPLGGCFSFVLIAVEFKLVRKRCRKQPMHLRAHML